MSSQTAVERDSDGLPFPVPERPLARNPSSKRDSYRPPTRASGAVADRRRDGASPSATRSRGLGRGLAGPLTDPYITRTFHMTVQDGVEAPLVPHLLKPARGSTTLLRGGGCCHDSLAACAPPLLTRNASFPRGIHAILRQAMVQPQFSQSSTLHGFVVSSLSSRAGRISRIGRISGIAILAPHRVLGPHRFPPRAISARFEIACVRRPHHPTT